MKPYQFALGCMICAASCTPLPDIEDKPVVDTLSPVDTSQFDAAACPTDGAPDPTGSLGLCSKKH